MMDLQIAEDIVPLGELKTHFSEKLQELRVRGRPFVVTQNGKAAAVLMSPEEFDRLTAKARFVAAVQAGLDDQTAERLVSNEEVGRRLDARFGVLKKPRK
jgi:prevent-host-death family protein